MHDIINIRVFYHGSTDSAFLVSSDEETTPVWLPMSLVEMEKGFDFGQGFFYEISVPEWLAVREGLV